MGFIFFKGIRHCHMRKILKLTCAQTKITSDIVAPILVFEEKEEAFEILSLLKNNRYIAFAGIYDVNDNLYSAYYREDINPKDIKSVELDTSRRIFVDDYIKVSEPVLLDGCEIGTVWFWTSL
jgi:hypothetical protein